MVFRLVSDSFDAVTLTARCGPETSDMTEDPQATVQDRVITTTNDRSGYFLLTPPKCGWSPGYYRCGLFAGEQSSAYSYVDEVRFRIVEPPGPDDSFSPASRECSWICAIVSTPPDISLAQRAEQGADRD